MTKKTHLPPRLTCFKVDSTHIPMLRPSSLENSHSGWEASHLSILPMQCTHGGLGGVRQFMDTKDMSSTKALVQHLNKCQPG